MYKFFAFSYLFCLFNSATAFKPLMIKLTFDNNTGKTVYILYKFTGIMHDSITTSLKYLRLEHGKRKTEYVPATELYYSTNDLSNLEGAVTQRNFLRDTQEVTEINEASVQKIQDLPHTTLSSEDNNRIFNFVITHGALELKKL